jgi:hypothetical protein
MSGYIFGFLVGVMITTMLFLASGCVTTTELCLECPYGTIELNRTMDTGK